MRSSKQLPSRTLLIALLSSSVALAAYEEKKPASEAPAKAEESAAADGEKKPSVLEQAMDKAKARDLSGAMVMVEKEMKDNPSLEACQLYLKICQANQFYLGMVKGYTEWLKLDPKNTSLYEQRGVANYFSGDFKSSVEDFDKYLKTRPEKLPHHWQLGLSLYAAEEYARGRAQFEEHQKVNAADVENAIWHYLCVAKVEGVDAAQKALYPYAGDSRAWAKAVYELYAGTGTPEAVLKAAESAENDAEKNGRLCYSQLYLGFHDEVHGKPKEALEHFKLADEAGKKVPNGSGLLSWYMKETARVFFEERQPRS